MAVTVGADIESICGKCGDVWHVVVAMVGDKIAKVVCKQCNRQHRYKPPGGSTAKVARISRKAKSTAARPRGQSKTNEPLVTYDPNRPARAYSIGASFAVGDRIEHKKFGDGVVEIVVGPGKIQVFFPGGRRVMAHERT